MTASHRVRRLATYLCTLVALTAQAQQPTQDDERARHAADLDALRQRIQALDANIGEITETYTAAEQARRSAERAVSAARRKLRNIEQERDTVTAKLEAQEKELETVTARINGKRQELATLLARRYRHGANSVAPFLTARDPNQIARDLHYLEYIGRAQLDIINTLRADLQEQKTLTQSIAARRAELTRLAADQQIENKKLEARLKDRTRTAAKLNTELTGKKAEIANLKQDEKNLSQLIVRLDTKRAEEARRAAERAAQEKAAAEKARKDADTTAPPAPPRTNTNLATGAIRRPPIALAPSGKSFSALRGQLTAPVAGGRIAARFDQTRADGGTRWHGLLIHATQGTPVRAAAAGRIVYADWLRGYGNLIIIDHGEGYLTVYGHNDALLAAVGEQVTPGQTIAQAGNSGSVAESGVYFEIRQKGQAINPQPWLRD